MSCRYTWWRITTKHDYTKPSWIIAIITQCQHIICFNCRTCLRKLRLFVIQTWWRSMSCCNVQVVSLLTFWHLFRYLRNEDSWWGENILLFEKTRQSYLSIWISYSFLQSTHLFWPCSYLFETLSYLFKPLSYYIFTVYILVCVYLSQTNKLCDGQLASSYNEYDIFMDKLASTCT